VMQSLFIGEGLNVIELVAFDLQNTIASRPASITITSHAGILGPKPRLYVLAVGVSNYVSDALKLNFAADDAIAIAEVFQTPTVVSEIYESSDVRTLVNEEVTSLRLQSAFSELSKIVRPTDVFVLYVAGHGFTEDGRYYFVPQDAPNDEFSVLLRNSISQDQIQTWLTQIPALKSVPLYDTCESGSVAGDYSGFRGPQQVVAVDKLSRATGRTVIAATTDVATAVEGSNNHGVFTRVFLDALELADKNHNGRIEVSEVANYVMLTLPELSINASHGAQTPAVNIIGSDFALINKFKFRANNER
jgi:uncharacterized caspase-like protein